MVNYKTNSSNNSSVLSQLPCKVVFNSEYPVNLGHNYYLPLTVALSTIALITVASNGTFLFVVFRSKRLQTRHNILIISLSITDFFTGVMVTPLYAASFIFLMNEKYPCALLCLRLTSFNTASVVSFGTLALISFEKYLAIIHTYYYERVMTKKRLTIMAVTVWIIGITFSTVSHVTGLYHPKIRVLMLSCLTYLGLIVHVAILFFYGRIFYEIQNVRQRIAAQNAVQNDQTVAQDGSKGTKTMAIVMGAFWLCYLPVLIVSLLWKPGENVTHRSKVELLVRLIADATILLNSVLNPVIYYIRMSLVKTEFSRVCC